jgi:uncharacterized membrane protein YdjX (TVP38/TMEM64 family)
MPETRRALFFQLAGVFVVIAIFLAVSRFLPIIHLIAALQQRVVHWGAWSALCYPLLFALCNVLLLPGGILSVGGGFFFGLWWGFVLVFVGNAIGAAVSFVLSRSLGQRWLSRKLSRYPALRRLEPAVEREGWKIIFLSQLHPLFPTSLLNYVYGLTRIQFGTYMLWTAIGRAPGLFLYVYFGTLGQFGLNLATGKSHPHIFEYWVWGGAFITTALLFLLLSRIALRALRETDETAREHSSGPPEHQEASYSYK